MFSKSLLVFFFTTLFKTAHKPDVTIRHSFRHMQLLPKTVTPANPAPYRTDTL
ncbi:hypothetical protein [Vibrio penaeicida]|uniref:hypothetical protein n=1 Tax=Vibrio penaeicida TaxID=104609 RepID=UPI00142D4119|nr:hypothetical protein [Vibrio penaeicida]